MIYNIYLLIDDVCYLSTLPITNDSLLNVILFISYIVNVTLFIHSPFIQSHQLHSACVCIICIHSKCISIIEQSGLSTEYAKSAQHALQHRLPISTNELLVIDIDYHITIRVIITITIITIFIIINK